MRTFVKIQTFVKMPNFYVASDSHNFPALRINGLKLTTSKRQDCNQYEITSTHIFHIFIIGIYRQPLLVKRPAH